MVSAHQTGFCVALLTPLCSPVCNGGENDDLILLCDHDGCHVGYHMYCLDPPLLQVPDDEWLCPQHDGSNGASARQTPGVAPTRSSLAPLHLSSGGGGGGGVGGGSARRSRSSKGTRKKRDPRAPKKPRGAYLFWAGAQREVLKREHPELSFADLSKQLGHRWNAMDEDAKRPFFEMALQDRQRHAEELRNYVPDLTDAATAAAAVAAGRADG